jgi:hypothetical protein
VPLTVGVTSSFAQPHDLGPSEILDVLGRADVNSVVLDGSLDPPRWEALTGELRKGVLPVLAVEAPAPAGKASSAQLCATDREEADVALQAAEATIRAAATLGARFVVLRLGELRAASREWSVAREKFLRGALDGRLAQRLLESRTRVAEPALDVARRQLDRLARAAEAGGLTLLIRNPRRFTDLPGPREIDPLLADLRGAPIAPLLDTAAAHLPAVMEVWPLDLTVAAFGEQSPLVYLGDACGPVAGLQPGRGIIDFAAVRLPKAAAVVFSPWPGLTPDEAMAALPAVAQLAARTTG